MKIEEIVLGVDRGGRAETLTFACKDRAELAIDPAIASPMEIARAVQETIAAPERTAASKVVLFIRVAARAGALAIEIADDASAGMRILIETREGAPPLIIEAKHADDEAIDALLQRVALAADAADSELLLDALGRERFDDAEDAESEDARTCAAAQRRATELTKAVRAIDDRMTLSVVPDWIWIATALGGIGVFMTVIALLYPEQRVVVLPAFVGAAALGFAAYAIMSFRELKKRSALLAERRELRARREAARKEVRAFAARGILPARDGGALPRDVPLISGTASGTAGPKDMPGRQVIVFSASSDKPA